MSEISNVSIEAYCWPQSIGKGSTLGIGLHVSCPGAYSVLVFDACDGDENRCAVLQLSGESTVHSIPADASSQGCLWPASLTVPTHDLPSSMYIVSITSVSNSDANCLAFFVVRPDLTGHSPKSRIICVLSTSTWCAYNDWGGSGWWNWERLFCQWARKNGYLFDVAISEDLHKFNSLLEGYSLFVSVGHDEYWSWAMRNRLDAFRLGGGNVLILSGNTMFWQVRFQEASSDLQTSQTNEGKDISSMICYKYNADRDPVCGTDQERTITSSWVDRRIGFPEYESIGLSFSKGGYSRYGLGVPRGSGSYTVYRPEHWVFNGTGLCFGDALGAEEGVVGYEVDGCPFTLIDGLPEVIATETGCIYRGCSINGDEVPVDLEPHSRKNLLSTLEILALAPATLWNQHQQPSRYADEPGELEAVAMAIYGKEWRDHLHKHSHNHAVFAISEGVFYAGCQLGTLINVGVTDWAYGLRSDEDVQRITINILARLG